MERFSSFHHSGVGQNPEPSVDIGVYSCLQLLSSFPRRREPSDIKLKIAPLRVIFFNKFKFPFSIPFLHGFFSTYRILDTYMTFEIH